MLRDAFFQVEVCFEGMGKDGREYMRSRSTSVKAGSDTLLAHPVLDFYLLHNLIQHGIGYRHCEKHYENHCHNFHF